MAKKYKSRKLKVKHYKPNVCYVMLIWGVYYYIGAHCITYKDFITDQVILMTSGNRVSAAYRAKLVTRPEVSDNVEILFVEEFDNKEDCLNRESELIKEYKDKYGLLCLNEGFGNQFFSKGIPCKEQAKEKKRLKMLGHKFDESFSLKVSNALGGKPIQQLDLAGNVLADWPYIAKATKTLGIQHIQEVCNGFRQTAGGFKWRYA